MFDIFDKPWPLLIAAVVVFFGIMTFRSFAPDKKRSWQLLIPVFLIAAAFGFDWLIQTDLEKINSVIAAGIKAVEEENPKAIQTIISENYSDSYHNTKDDFIYYCDMLLAEPLVEKNRKINLVIEKSGFQATAVFTVLVAFDKQSYVYKEFKQFLLVKAKLDLRKQSDKSWLIKRTELLELDRQSVSWKNIR
ncbi:MAG: hypothetical protein KAS69_03835 [Planctomycetes bacterium]|nr:hypothetical protein [Planctomycetota bacterium]